jgi:hypothetical protein
MAFFSAVFHDTPNAHIKTSLAEWDDSSVYFRTVRQTRAWNGSVQCHCDVQDKERAIYEPRHALVLERRQARAQKKQQTAARVDALLASALPFGV